MTNPLVPKNALKHGEMLNGIKSPEYRAYELAKHRCSPTGAKRKYYADKGILFLFTDFSDFLQAVGRKPHPSYSLDRIDNTKSYCHGNVRWATKTEQARNKDKTLRLNHHGELRSLKEWAEIYHLNYYSIRKRFQKQWCSDCILSPELNVGCSHC